MSSSMPLKLFMLGIEPPFNKMSLVVVLAEVAIAVAGLVPVVNGCMLRLAGAVVVAVDRLIGVVVVLFDRVIGAVVVLFGRLIDAGIALDKLVLEPLPIAFRTSSLSTG